MLPSPRDTIAALSSPPGRSARAVVRLSGAEAVTIASRFAGPLPTGRVAIRLLLPGWPPVDASAWVFRAPRSATGEDVVELHVPGSTPLVVSLLRQLEASGARAALPGEITRRAFLAGKIGLEEASAILALTRAEADGEVRAAARALAGGLHAAVAAAKEEALRAAARLAAAVDVFDDDEAPGDAPAALAVASDLDRLASSLGTLLARASPPSRAEPTVVLAGAANAGKSTLLNALAGRPLAIVSAAPGTTRDAVSARVVLAGRSVVLVDTAGEKEAASAVETLALERSREAAATADLVVLVSDGTSPRVVVRPRDVPSLVVFSKADLVGASARARLAAEGLVLSAKTGDGLDALARAVACALDSGGGGGDVLATARARERLASARERVVGARDLLRGPDPARHELAGVELEDALDALGDIAGAVVPDDVLDRLFGEFCVGK